MDNFIDWIVRYKMYILGAVVGLAIAILLLTIGFWKTLLIVAFAAIFAIIFGSKRLREGFAGFFVKLFSRLGDKE